MTLVRFIRASGDLVELSGDLYETLDIFDEDRAPEHPATWDLTRFARLPDDDDGVAVYRELT